MNCAKGVKQIIKRFYTPFPRRLANGLTETERNQRGKAAVILKPNVIKLLPEEMGELHDNDVVLRMGAVVLGRHIMGLTLTGPGASRGRHVMGTMGAGTITALGPDVYGQLSIGDKVAIEPIVYCGHCIACSQNMYDSCRNRQTCGLPPKPGFLSKYYSHPWKLVHKLPESMSLVEGAFCYVTANCINAYNKSGANSRSRVAIVGINLEGAMATKVFSKKGVGTIVAIDSRKWRLVTAKSMGATRIVDIATEYPPLDIVDAIAKDALGGPADVVIDTLHSPATARIARQIVQTEGTVILLGPSNPLYTFNNVRFLNSARKGIKVLEIQYYGDQFRHAIDLLEGERVTEQIVPYELPISQTLHGMTVARSHLSFSVACIIRCDMD